MQRELHSACQEGDKDLQCVLGLAKKFISSASQVLNFEVSKDLNSLGRNESLRSLIKWMLEAVTGGKDAGSWNQKPWLHTQLSSSLSL